MRFSYLSLFELFVYYISGVGFLLVALENSNSNDIVIIPLKIVDYIRFRVHSIWMKAVKFKNFHYGQ